MTTLKANQGGGLQSVRDNFPLRNKWGRERVSAWCVQFNVVKLLFSLLVKL